MKCNALSRKLFQLLFLAIFVGCGQQPKTAHRSGEPLSKVDMNRLRGEVEAFCGDCHKTPSPATFPLGRWHREVLRGFEFYELSGRTDLKVPDQDEVSKYFRALSSKQLEFPDYSGISGPPKLALRCSVVEDPDVTDGEFTLVSYAKWVQFEQDQRPWLVYCEMRSGFIRAVQFQDRVATQPRLLAKLNSPAHIEPCDLDKDGRMDLVVADLGTVQADDHDKGRAVWLRQRKDSFDFDPIELKSGLGRVADVRPGDFDGDGDIDLIVAAFGWLKTGQILWLENLGKPTGAASFKPHLIDRRHGASHVPTCDLNDDGHLDFIALFSQEHEVIELFLNQGNGTFKSREIYSAGDPAFGSNGIELVDLDGDDDLDVLYVNGDMFDNFYAKPYHAVHWLENKGALSFEHHELASLPGVYRALPGDLDGDGDLDIAAVVFMPEPVFNDAETSEFDSVIWLEQTDTGTFERRRLERSNFLHTTFEIADMDGDGRLDLAVGTNSSGEEKRPPIKIWWNSAVTAEP